MARRCQLEAGMITLTTDVVIIVVIVREVMHTLLYDLLG